ncbi:MAG: HD domain-containing protein [Anaerolineales bacterium]|nr:HD domain-containing protein [Anaerolineales bacterium]
MPTLEQARQWYPATDPTHGFDHVERVYRLAERLALAEAADLEIVRSAVLLHDAAPPSQAREEEAEQIAAQRQNHHHASAEFARQVLAEEGWPEARIAAVLHCIRAHRFRDRSQPPETVEARVVFDADKLDAIGATGVARAIGYAQAHGQPLYAPVSDHFLHTGQPLPGEAHSAYHEYLFKLRHIQERLLTPSGRDLARQRHHLMVAYFTQLEGELRGEA